MVASAADWEEVYTQDEVTVSKMDLEGTKFYAFKGETVMDAPATRIMHVLLDNDHRIEWVDRLYQAVELEKNGPFDYVLYQAFDLPLTFADRDYVYRGQAKRVSDTVVELHLVSVDHADKPAEDTVGVRAELVNSLYRLTDLEDGKTRVEVEIQTDPKGWMPIWLVNLVQKDWPLETLNGMRGELSKDYCGDSPLPEMGATASVAAEGSCGGDCECGAEKAGCDSCGDKSEDNAADKETCEEGCKGACCQEKAEEPACGGDCAGCEKEDASCGSCDSK